ncbi:MAG: amidohydrolase family protein, partial [Candidatus Caldarchaeum sp.]
VFLVRGRFVVTMDGSLRVLRHGGVVVDDGVIVEVGPYDVLRNNYRGVDVVGDEWKVVAPGFINCHYHSREQLAQTLFPDGLGEVEWFRKFCLPYHQTLSPDDEKLAFTLALTSMALNGVTTFADGGLIYPSTTLEALQTIPLRCFASTWCWDLPETIPKTAEEALAELKNLYQSFMGRMKGLVRVCAAPISVETCSPQLLEEVFHWAREKELKTYIHVASFRQDKSDGSTAVEYLYSKSLLGQDTNLLHAIHLTDRDVRLVAETGAAAVCCPMSSLTKGKGLTIRGKYPEMLRLGVRVGLGADGAPSTHHTDILRLASLFAGLFRDSRMDAGVIPAVEALKAATSTAAMVLGLEDEVGSLEVGKRADIVLLDVRRPAFTPSMDIIRSLVFSATGDAVDTVIVDGRLVVSGGRVLGLDYEKLYRAVEKTVERIGSEFQRPM